jgi:hypothetical protein
MQCCLLEIRMNAEPNVSTGDHAPDSGTPLTPGWANRHHAAQPARPLGPKASLRHARRQQRTSNPASDQASHETLRLSTRDALITLVMQRVGNALYVERTQRRPLGTHLVQSMVFETAEEFARWCDAEPLRFNDPPLHARLRRRAEEFFGERR